MFGLSKWSAKIALIEELCSDGRSNDDMVRVIIRLSIGARRGCRDCLLLGAGFVSQTGRWRRSGNRQVGASYFHPYRLNKDHAAFVSAMRND